jgi:hypothetical protein
MKTDWKSLFTLERNQETIMVTLRLTVDPWPKRKDPMHHRFAPRLVSVISATTIVAVWMSIVALPSAQSGQTAQPAPAPPAQPAPRGATDGIKEAEAFITAGDAASGAAGRARAQIQDTLAAYNALVSQPTKDMKGDFKKLLTSAKSTDTRVAEARDRMARMEAAGEIYFSGRAASVKEIQSADLLDKAQTRLNENKQEYAGVTAALRDAGQSLETMRGDLNNQITYLGSDLTPGAMASIKPEAQKLNDHGAQTLAKVDQAMAAAAKYFNSMRPTKG